MSHSSEIQGDAGQEPVAESVAHTYVGAVGDGDADRVDTAQLLQLGRSEPDAIESSVRPFAYAVLSLILGISGVIGGLFVMWMLPFALGALLFAGLARREGQTGRVVTLGLVTGLMGLGFAGVWLIYALGRIAL